MTEEITLYRCKECGKLSVSLGYLHGHIESHRGFFGLQLPWRIGDVDELMQYTEVIDVNDYTVTYGAEFDHRGNND